MNHIESFAVDARGDLWVHVLGADSDGNSTPTRFRVCSRTLARSSPVFDKMLFGGFAEAQRHPGDEWKIVLPEDSAPSMRRLFRLMHNTFRYLHRGRFDCLSVLGPLYDLTVAADKYDCMELIHPWARSWLGDVCAYMSTLQRLILDLPAKSTGERAQLEKLVLPPNLFGG
ncbi:hypothetical protein Micbo1qcDRAFT_177123 [Microdochium bolleyi]|uniref:BTB domain-containing protein n=1 Tax=Microdochium bolleyi TaxID=196109 RepID=A0A136IYV4_9PEZI|nr:hypothetical protein Micbo1qcDRAFT_177123 [Microdochium bolleyi]